jgi:TetR/AcrR family transcriptional regulator, repressor for neighboring sulfatase
VIFTKLSIESPAKPFATAKRLRRTPEEARQLILDTAQEMIARSGPEGLRLQDIATAAGISHPLILHHFGSRAGLVRALARRATAELRDRLVVAMNAPDYSLEEQISRVFEALRGGLAQTLAWLAATEPDGGESGKTMIMREIIDTLHARRVANAQPGTRISREDTEWGAFLVTVAAFGDAVYGEALRRSAGIEAGPESDRRFRVWFAELLRSRQQPADDRAAKIDQPQQPL